MIICISLTCCSKVLANLLYLFICYQRLKVDSQGRNLDLVCLIKLHHLCVILLLKSKIIGKHLEDIAWLCIPKTF